MKCQTIQISQLNLSSGLFICPLDYENKSTVFNKRRLAISIIILNSNLFCTYSVACLLVITLEADHIISLN